MGLAREIVSSGLHPTHAQAINGSVAAAVTAAGTNLATATLLVASINNIATAAVGTGVALPIGTALGDSFIVHNSGANALLVYAPPGTTINGAASVSLAVNKNMDVFTLTPTLFSAVLSA